MEKLADWVFPSPAQWAEGATVDKREVHRAHFREQTKGVKPDEQETTISVGEAGKQAVDGSEPTLSGKWGGVQWWGSAGAE
jgi:hypothetical protein